MDLSALSTSDKIALVSAIFALAAVVVSLIAWRFPLSPKKKKIPEYFGPIDLTTADTVIDFLVENSGHIVRIRAYLPMDDEDLLDMGEDEDGVQYSRITLRANKAEDGSYGGMELAVNAEKGSKANPILFANGSYHLSGYFTVQSYPGMWQGFVAYSITEVSAEQMALRG